MSVLDAGTPRPDAERHAGVAAIALMEAGKGVLAVLAAAGLAIAGPAPLRTMVHDALLRVGADPDHGAMAGMVAQINPDAIHLTIGVLLAYAALRALEAWGLWHHRAWASWLGCISAAIYLPLDVYAIFRHPGWVSALVLAINIAVVAILAQDLRRRRQRQQPLLPR